MKNKKDVHVENIESFSMEDLKQTALDFIKNNEKYYLEKKLDKNTLEFGMSMDWEKNGEKYQIFIQDELDLKSLAECKIIRTPTAEGFQTYFINPKNKEPRRIDFATGFPEFKEMIYTKNIYEKAKIQQMVKDSKILDWFRKDSKHEAYPPEEKVFFKYEDKEKDAKLILCTLDLSMKNEVNRDYSVSEENKKGNYPNLKKYSLASIDKEGKVKHNLFKSKEYDTHFGMNSIFVMDKNGRLFTSKSVSEEGESIHHSFMLKNSGFGKPVSCAGHLEIDEKTGKITKIDNDSGHYMPNEDQLILAIQHLDKKGAISKDAVIRVKTGPNSDKNYTLHEIKQINPDKLLDKYKPLEYYEKKATQTKQAPQKKDQGYQL